MRTELYRDSDRVVSEEHDHYAPNNNNPLLCVEYINSAKPRFGETEFFRDDDIFIDRMTGGEARAMFALMGQQAENARNETAPPAEVEPAAEPAIEHLPVGSEGESRVTAIQNSAHAKAVKRFEEWNRKFAERVSQ